MSSIFETRYKSLNNSQKKAVDTIDGPVMVIAGPGSGKTELLSMRVGAILKQGSARASNILLLTFTETAAQNMRDRLEKLIGADAYRVAIYTFHGFCTDIIGRYPEYFYDAHHVRPASDLVQNEILEELFKRLPHGHAYGKKHPELGYSYLNEVRGKIKDIKKGGLSPERFREIIQENECAFEKMNTLLQEHLPERIGKGSQEACIALKDEMSRLASNLGDVYAKSLDRAIANSYEEDKTQPLTAWKSKMTGKTEDGDRVFKDFLQIPKLYFLADMYEGYQEALLSRGMYDYEDMLLQVIDALSSHISLRTEIEEQYHYIMVDEFQDTNNAQLSLVKAISSNPVHEDRPNVCVVGDDDQAVYKFQGANISNIHTFKELYQEVETIVLTDNYRSTQKVLDFARGIVLQGEDRLEKLYPEIRKDLIAKNSKIAEGNIYQYSFATPEEEYGFIASEVRRLLDEGVPAKEISLIARKHRYLTALLPSLDALQVPYTYMRKENVFDEQHVKELVTLCRLLATVGAKEFERDDLLPEILSFPFWGLDRIQIWRVAEYAKRENVTWLEAMHASGDKKIRDVGTFLIELGVVSQTAPLEIVLDTLIGSKEALLPAEDEEDDEPVSARDPILATTFTSPYKRFYFGEDALKKNPSLYINFLSSLRVFMQALKEYKEHEMLRVHDVGAFVDRHVEYGIALINETPFAHNENSVQLLTSHKAKGLEFEYAFIVSADDSVWAGHGMPKKIAFPKNLLLETEGDTEDDFIRLFYVAITRARHTVYITHHASPLRFLSHADMPKVCTDAQTVDMPELLAEGLQIYHAPPFAQDEKALLQKIVEGYMLPPTHLNNFLDLTKGGPTLFLEQNLLRFPQAKTASSVFGTAIHKAIEDSHVLMREKGKLPPLEKILAVFEKELKKGRMLPYEEEKQRKRGQDVLTRYYELKKDGIRGEHIVELNFAHQGVEIGGALLTGKIDKIVRNDDGTWTVIDFKTGRGVDDWDDPEIKDYMELKLHHYRHQLMMYKLLVENSRDYQRNKVSEGVLEFVEEITAPTHADRRGHDAEEIKEIRLVFDESTREELDRFKALVVAIYKKISSLDLQLDIERYPKTLDGIRDFEDDLIAGRI